MFFSHRKKIEKSSEEYVRRNIKKVMVIKTEMTFPFTLQGYKKQGYSKTVNQPYRKNTQ